MSLSSRVTQLEKQKDFEREINYLKDKVIELDIHLRALTKLLNVKIERSNAVATYKGDT